MVERHIPIQEAALTSMHEERHGRPGGEDNQGGTLILLTPAKRVTTAAGGSGSPANPMALF